MTPGRSLPSKSGGISWLPVAATTARARILNSRWPRAADSQWSWYQPVTEVPVSTSTPARSSRSSGVVGSPRGGGPL